MLVARYTSERNHVWLLLDPSRISIVECTGGISRTIASAANPGFRAGDSAELAIRTVAGTVACFVDGKLVVKGSLTGPYDRAGGVGFKVWDAVENAGSVVASDVVVTEEHAR